MATLAGFLAGYAFYQWWNDTGELNAEIEGLMRQLEAEKIHWYGDGIISMATSILPSNTTLWGFTQQHWNRAAEMAVADRWTLGNDYDPNFILEHSMMRANIEAFIYNWQAALDNAFTHSIIALMNMYEAEGAAYMNDVTMRLVWDEGYFELRNSIMDVATLVTDAVRGQSVYVDATTHVEGGTFQHNTSGVLYNLTTSNIIMRDIWTGSSTTSGNTITLVPGANLISETHYNEAPTTKMRGGLYEIETNGATIAGPLSMAADEKAAHVMGTIVHASDSITWFTYENDTNFVNGANFKAETKNLSIQIGYIDRNESPATITTQIAGIKGDTGQDVQLIRDWNNLIERMNITIEIAARSGGVMWTIFDICQENLPFLAPSSIITYVPGQQFSWQDAAIFAVSQMMQIARAYDLYGDTLKEELTKSFSFDSLNLWVRADVYLNDVRIYEDIVFTPIAMLNEQTLTVGKDTVWRNTGIAQVWGTGDLTGWTGPVITSNFELIHLTTGYTLDVIQISKNGELIETVTLSPEEIKRYTTDPGDPPTPSRPPLLSSPKDITALLILFFGILIIGIGVYTRSPTVLALGAVVLSVGLVLYFWNEIWAWIRGLAFGWWPW